MLSGKNVGKLIATPQELGDQVFEILKESILAGELKPGDKIVSFQIAKELGVSSTPVREAIKQLEKEGLVCRPYHKTPTVKSMTVQDVYEIFTLREVLEGLAARLAADNITEGEIDKLEQVQEVGEEFVSQSDWSSYEIRSNMPFHNTILVLAKNERLSEVLSKIHTHNNFLITTRLTMPGASQKSVREHRSILDALREKDGTNAERLMRAHISRAMKNTIELLERRK